MRRPSDGMRQEPESRAFLCANEKTKKRNEENTIYTMSLGMFVCKTVLVLCTIIRSPNEQT